MFVVPDTMAYWCHSCDTSSAQLHDIIEHSRHHDTSNVFREHVKISTLDENVNRLTFVLDPNIIGLRLKSNIEYVCHT